MFRSLVVALALLSACNVVISGTAGSGVAGSGVAASEQREVPAFTKLELDGSFAVEVTVGPARSVRVEADDNIIPLISTEVTGDTLKVSSRGSFSTTNGIKVTITTPTLTAVDHDGSGRVRVQGVAADSFAAALGGSGSIALTGKADSLTADLDGSGSIAAAELVTTRATVSLSGSGNAEINASAKIVAKISGSGSVRYTGGATDIVRDIDGSGSVSPL